MGAGELTKMKLVAYKERGFKDEAGDEYDVFINPESYAVTYGVVANATAAQGGSGSTSTYNRSSEQTMTFKFLFDGTGAIRSGGGPGGINITPTILGASEKRDVVQDINQLKKVVYKYDGTTHESRYVQLRWGALLYNCKLQSMTITFKLFRPDGYPLRAEADCTFTSAIDEETLAKTQNKQSPDITKLHTVIEGDTLPLLCFREYGDSKYYYQVARFNKLTNLKQLKPGTKLIFPPIAK